MTDVVQPRRDPLTFLRTGAPAQAELSRGYKVYIMFVLGLVAMLSQMDKNILSVLLVPIQKDIGATNTQMGLLAGGAFAAAYAVAALPMGRIADIANRRNVMAAAVAVWSVATGLCGLAGNFMQLALARMGVALGEAAQQPISLSVVGDLYSQRRRGSAIAALTIGGLVGLSAGATLAGVLNDHYGWHLAFLLLAIPSILVAALLWLTVPEPVRGAQDGGARHDPLAASTWASLKYIFSIPSVWILALAQCVLASAQQSWLTWLPKLFMSVHHLTTTQMSVVYGLVVGLGALFSIVIGGVLSDWMTKFGARWRMYYVVASLLLSAPLAAVGVLAGDLRTAIIEIFLYTLIAGGITPAAAAAGLGVVRPKMRALMVAVLFFMVFAVGGTIGPLAIGMATDALQHTYGDAAIRYALLLSPALLVLSALVFLAASFTIDRDTAATLESPSA